MQTLTVEVLTVLRVPKVLMVLVLKVPKVLRVQVGQLLMVRASTQHLQHP